MAVAVSKNQDRKDRKVRNEEAITRFCRQHDIRLGKAIGYESFTKNGCNLRWYPETNKFDVKGGGSRCTLQALEKAMEEMPNPPLVKAGKGDPEPPKALPKIMLALQWLVNLK